MPSTESIVDTDDDGPTNGDRREWLSVRTRLLGRAAAIGVVLGLVGTVLSVAITADSRFASAQVFSLGALALGFALLGWSGSVAAGRSIEAAQTYLETGTGWTEKGSRRAMARIGGFGTGVMVGASIVTLLA
jgi:hypothetical protein